MFLKRVAPRIRHTLFGKPRPVGPHVVLYHGLVECPTDVEIDQTCTEVAEFRNHVEYLSRQRQVLSVQEYIEAVRANQTLDERVAVIIFDDALESVYLLAHPLLKEAGLPYAVAAVSRLTGTDRTIWSHEVRHHLLTTDKAEIDDVFSRTERKLPFGSREERVQHTREVLRKLSKIPEQKRTLRLESLRQSLEIDDWSQTVSRYPSLRIMSAEQLRYLHAHGVEILAHGATHIPLHEFETNEILSRETRDAKHELEVLIRAPLNIFVYPNGIASPSAERAVIDSGFDAAFVCNRLGRVGSRMHTLNRHCGDGPLDKLKLQIGEYPVPVTARD